MFKLHYITKKKTPKIGSNSINDSDRDMLNIDPIHIDVQQPDDCKSKMTGKNPWANRIMFNSLSVDYVMIMLILTCYTWRSVESRWGPMVIQLFVLSWQQNSYIFPFNVNDILSEKTIYPSQHILVVVS